MRLVFVCGAMIVSGHYDEVLLIAKSLKFSRVVV